MGDSIVIFDSGLGGVTALMEAIRAMPAEHFIYYGDTAHVPYGPKDAEEIQGYLDHMMASTRPYSPKAVLLACNTATVTSADFLRKKYTLPIVGMEPAVKPAIEHDVDLKRILVLSTEGTGKSTRLRRLVEKFDDDRLVDILPLPNLVDFAERLEFDTDAVRYDLETILASYSLEEYGALVLGCTHFIWYRDLFRELLPEHMEILDGNAATVRQLMRKLEGNIKKEGEGKLQMAFTGKLSEDTAAFLRSRLPKEVEFISLGADND